MIAVSDSARAHIIKQLEELDLPILFFGLKGGGCAGFEYNWQPMTEEEYPFFGDPGVDQVIPLDEDDRYQMIIDETSALMLNGSLVDLKTDFVGKQLVVDNPNAKGSCGCGTSISV